MPDLDTQKVGSAADLGRFIQALMDETEADYLAYRQRVAQGSKWDDPDLYVGPWRGALENLQAWLVDAYRDGAGTGPSASPEAWAHVATCLLAAATYE